MGAWKLRIAVGSVNEVVVVRVNASGSSLAAPAAEGSCSAPTLASGEEGMSEDDEAMLIVTSLAWSDNDQVWCGIGEGGDGDGWEGKEG